MSNQFWRPIVGKWFTEHPASVNETYSEHFSKALHFAMQLFRAGTACLIHAFIPGCCVTTGSKAIKELHNEMVTFRVKNTDTNTPDTQIEYMI